MVRGRKQKPIALKLLNGNPGKRELNMNEPKPPPFAPEIPAWLKKNKIAKKEWQRIVPELERLGMLSKIDGAALEGYCKAYSRWVEAETELDELKTTTMKTDTGYHQQLPQITIAQKYLGIVKNMCGEFGLTPSARARMVLPGQVDEEDEMEKLLKKKVGNK